MAEATPPSPSGTLRRIALVVAAATALSKLAGLVRQQAIAAAFGWAPPTTPSITPMCCRASS